MIDLHKYPHRETLCPHVYTFSIPCRYCDEIQRIPVPGRALYELNQGESVQNACSMMSDSDREMLITRICPACWKNLFGGFENVNLCVDGV